MISLLNLKSQRVQSMIEDTSSAAWYQQSILVLNDQIMWTVKECIENYEYHLIRRVELHADFYQSLLINKGLPPASLKEVS
jgi:hypothetical protein